MAEPAPRLSEKARDRISAAERLIKGIEAVAELARLVGPGGGNPWRTACDIARRLHHFEHNGPWGRIRRGERAPKDRVEALLATIALSGIGRTKERVYDLLRPSDEQCQ